MIERVFLSAAQRRLIAQGTPVFCYHNLGPAPTGARDPFLWVGAAEFERQLAALRAAGLASGSLEDVGGPAGAKAVITFDDGCRNVLEHGLEALRRQGFCAIQFLVAGRIGGSNEWDRDKGEAPVSLMNREEVRAWLAAGHAIGSHSLSHAVLTRAADAREEIFSSKRRLEDEFGVEVRHFAYPFGKWNAQVRQWVIEAGYQSACTVRTGVAARGDDPFSLPRLYAYSGPRLLAKALHRLLRGAKGGKAAT